MAKNPEKGKCVHCLSAPVNRTWDHMFPKAWYPDTTPDNLEKWQIPSRRECNERLGRIENDLIGRVALTLNANNPASKGLAEKALRAINPAEARDEGDAAARDARAKKILGEIFKGEATKGKNVVPGLGERWGRPIEQQVAIKIPDESFPAITEKIVRGLAFREEGDFIEPPQELVCYLADEQSIDDVKELLAKYGKEFKREPGLAIRRANLDVGDLYEITYWDQFRTYATVSKPFLEEDDTSSKERGQLRTEQNEQSKPARLPAIEPDKTWHGMWRVRLGDGSLSDMVNLTRATDAVMSIGRAVKR